MPACLTAGKAGISFHFICGAELSRWGAVARISRTGPTFSLAFCAGFVKIGLMHRRAAPALPLRNF